MRTETVTSSMFTLLPVIVQVDAEILPKREAANFVACLCSIDLSDGVLCCRERRRTPDPQPNQPDARW